MTKERQQELFRGLAAERNRDSDIESREQKFAVSLTCERAIFAVIGILAALALSFALGVDRGKHLAQNKKVAVQNRGNSGYFVGPFRTKAEAEKLLKESRK